MMEVVTRQEALELGLPFYFTGKPCPSGHLSQKSTRWKHCCECRRVKARAVARANPELNRKKVLEWQLANRDKASRKSNAWYHANAEKAKASTLAWERANPDKVSAKRHRRRARKIEAEGNFTDTDIARLMKLQKGKCALCRCRITRKNKTVDHIIALSKGGSNHPRNLQILCMPCNQSKWNFDPIDHAQRKGFLL